MTNNKGKVFLILLIIFGVAFVLIGFGGSDSAPDNMVVITDANGNTLEVDIANWTSYTNTEFGFSFKHQPEYIVREERNIYSISGEEDNSVSLIINKPGPKIGGYSILISPEPREARRKLVDDLREGKREGIRHEMAIVGVPDKIEAWLYKNETLGGSYALALYEANGQFYAVTTLTNSFEEFITFLSTFSHR